ncbi:MAG: hypothetical protein R2775_03240 [Flavobacteriaceae bacterium]
MTKTPSIDFEGVFLYPAPNGLPKVGKLSLSIGPQEVPSPFSGEGGATIFSFKAENSRDGRGNFPKIVILYQKI